VSAREGIDGGRGDGEREKGQIDLEKGDEKEQAKEREREREREREEGREREKGEESELASRR